MIQARSSEGLSSYHALVVLNLAQINSYTAYLLFLCRLTIDDTEATGIGLPQTDAQDSPAQLLPVCGPRMLDGSVWFMVLG